MEITVLPTVPCTIKNPFCLGTLSTDQFENADRVPEPFEPGLNPPLLTSSEVAGLKHVKEHFILGGGINSVLRLSV